MYVDGFISDLSAKYGFQVETLTCVEIYEAHVSSDDREIIGPIYPIDAFSDRDQTLISRAIDERMLRVHRIADRWYATGGDLNAFMSWTRERVTRPHRWREDLELVTHHLDGIAYFDLSDPLACTPFNTIHSVERHQTALRRVREEVRGPIAPLSHFWNEGQQILNWCIRAGHLAAVTIDGVKYVSYWGVYSDMLGSYFDSEFDHPAAWDGTYDETWSSLRRVKSEFVLPRGFKDAVRSDSLPRIHLSREGYRMNARGEPCFVQAAYPRHVADRAAEMFRALYREEGFIERFRQYEYYDEERDANDLYRIEPVSSFGLYEAEWFRSFAAEGSVRISTYRGEDYISVSDLMYYDMFAAKIVEDELDFNFEVDPGVNCTVTVMLDGTFGHSGPMQPLTLLRRKQDGFTER